MRGSREVHFFRIRIHQDKVAWVLNNLAVEDEEHKIDCIHQRAIPFRHACCAKPFGEGRDYTDVTDSSKVDSEYSESTSDLWKKVGQYKQYPCHLCVPLRGTRANGPQVE